MSSTIRFNNAYIIGISFISALGGYLFGFDFAVISGALPFLRTEFVLNAWWEGFLTGSLALGCIVGCLAAGKIADKYGRKPGLAIAALVFAISSVGMAFSNGLTFFVVMRFAAGIGVGMASMLSPMYIAEVSPAKVRGRNVAINQLTIVIGILITNLVNYKLADYGPDAWRWMFGLGVVPSVLFLLGVLWLPESPRWLMSTGMNEKAEKILDKIGSSAYVATTMGDIKRSMADHVGKQSYAAVFAKGVRPAVLVGITLAVFQQFCGINVVFNYTSTIFESVGASLDRQLFETVAIGIVNLVFTIFAMWQVDKLGRRPLMLIGSIGLSIIYVVLAYLLQSGAAAGLVYWLLPEQMDLRGVAFTKWGVLGAIGVGLAVGALMSIITEYYTAMGKRPVMSIIKQSSTGHATNVIGGLAIGMESTFLPILVLAGGIWGSYACAGLYGVAIAAAGMMATTAMQLAIDAFGPIADNAGGIAEMSELPPDVREKTDVLDAVGNTTAASGKGFAIASAALTALALFAAYVGIFDGKNGKLLITGIDIYKANVLSCLFVGAMIPFIFSS
ncbi:MAG: MFS transporter, partial [Sphingobacteriales bacterium]